LTAGRELQPNGYQIHRQTKGWPMVIQSLSDGHKHGQKVIKFTNSQNLGQIVILINCSSDGDGHNLGQMVIQFVNG
jgi:hypothetical protein